MITFNYVLLALCTAATAACAIAARKKARDFAGANYIVRSVAGSMTAVTIHIVLVFFLQWMLSYTENVYPDYQAGVVGSITAMVILLLAVISLCYSYIIFSKKHLVLIAMPAAVLLIGVISAVAIAISEESELISFVWPIIAGCAALSLLCASDILFDIKRKVQRIFLIIINVIVIGAAAYIVISFIGVGVSDYQAGLLDEDRLGNALAVVIPAAIALIIPPVLSIGSIITYILSAFNKNQ